MRVAAATSLPDCVATSSYFKGMKALTVNFFSPDSMMRWNGLLRPLLRSSGLRVDDDGTD